MKTGAGTKIHKYCNIYDDVVIGNNCTIGSYVEIGKGVRIGDFCSIQAFTFIPEGVMIRDNVFIGPHVCFINCRYPSANRKYNVQVSDDAFSYVKDEGKVFDLEPTIVYNDVVIGANSTIMCGVCIEQGAIIGAGSVITKHVLQQQKIIQHRGFPPCYKAKVGKRNDE